MNPIVLIVLAGAAAAASAQSLSQPNTDLCERSFISDAVAGQFNNRRQAETLRLNSTTSVNSIRWWGGTSPFGGVSDLSNVDAYRVVIFTDAAGVPNSLAAPVYDQEFSKAATNPRASGFRTFQENAPQFEHTAQLPGPLSLNGGTNYWITIGARLVDGNGAAWRWSSSLEGNFLTAQQNPFGEAWTVFDPSGANYAFELNPVADGAICLPEGGCIIGTEQQAFTSGGIYQGDGTDCVSGGCDPFAVFTQPPTQPCNQSFNSDAVPGQFAQRLSADNFTLASDAVVDAVRWWGGSQFFIDFDLFNFASWTVTIYGSLTDGSPDDNNVIYAETFDQVDTNPLFTPYRNGRNADLYEHAVQLATPVDLVGGQQYWISIGTTNFDPGSDGWRWSGSLTGDGTSAQKNWETGEFPVFTGNAIQYAFQLLGTAEDTAPGCSPADLAEPFDVVNVFDLFAYLNLYGANDPAADLAEPFGTINVFDLFEYLSVYAEGCP